MTPRSRLLALVAAAVVILGLGVTGFVLTRGDDGSPAPAVSGAQQPQHPAGYGTSIAQEPTATVDRQDTAEVLCQLQPQAVRALSTISTSSPDVESLRDGLPLLTDRLARLTQAAIGRPALAPVVTDLTWVRKAWQAAIEADDRGKAKQAAAAVAAADKRLASMTSTMDAAYPGRAADCT